MSETQWYQRHNTLSQDCLGVHPHIGGRSSDILTVGRSADKRLLCTGDVYGNVRLFRYPCQRPGSPYKEFVGHSPGGVSRVAFSVKDQYVVSLGREDKIMFQWSVHKVDDEMCKPAEMQIMPPQQLLSLSDLSITEMKTLATGVSSVSYVIQGVDMTKDMTSMPVTAPDAKLSLTAVLGVGGSACSRMHQAAFPIAFYSGTGDVSTVAGRIPLMLRGDRVSQMLLHVPGVADIGAVTISADLRYLATGEKCAPYEGRDEIWSSNKGKIRVFSTGTGLLLQELPEIVPGGVMGLSFSGNGLYLAAIGRGRLSSLSVFYSPQGVWNDAVLAFTSPTNARPSSFLTFITKAPSPMHDYHLVTGGEAPVRFWKLTGRNVVSCVGQYPNKELQKAAVTSLLCIREGQAIAGDAAGGVSVWKGNICESQINGAHESAISAMCKWTLPPSSSSSSSSSDKKTPTPTPTLGVITASCDCVKLWSDTFTEVRSLSVSDLITRLDRSLPRNSFITSVATDAHCHRLLIATSSSLVAELAMDSQAIFLLAEGHHAGTFSAIAAHPTDPRFLLTAGAEGILRVWNLVTRRVVEVHQTGFQLSDVTFRPDGSSLALSYVSSGESGACVLIMNFNPDGGPYLSTMQKIVNVGTGRVNMLRYSPDEMFLAVGSEDHAVYLYDVRHSYKLKGNVRGHSMGVSGVDFAFSGKYLRSFSKTKDSLSIETRIFELHDEHVPAAVEITDSTQLQKLDKERWATISSVAAPEAKACHTVIEQNNTDKIENQSEITSAGSLPVSAVSFCTDPKQKNLVAAYTDGSMRMFRNPAGASTMSCHLYHGHSTGPVSLSFTCDGKYVCSAGRCDGAVMMWEFTP